MLEHHEAGLISSKDRFGKNSLSIALDNLVNVGKEILKDPRESVTGELSAKAVADYLDVLIIDQIREAEYVYNIRGNRITGKQQFGAMDYILWRELADMLRHPKSYRNSKLAVAKAWEVLQERSARFELVSGKRYPATLTFSWAAGHILHETGIALGVPHMFDPNPLPHRYCFIP